jgi:hypothetical protein
MGDVTITADTRDLRRALLEFSVVTGRGLKEVVEHNMKIIIQKAIMITPPGMGIKESASVARARGEKKVESDIRKVLWAPDKALRRSRKASVGQIKKIHQGARGRDGQVKKGAAVRLLGVRITVSNATPVEKADLDRYIRERKKKVGIMRSGWNAAAARFGANPPGWVARHRGPGTVEAPWTQNGMTVTAENRVSFIRGFRDADRRLEWVVKAQTGAVNRQLLAIAKKGWKR